MDKLKKEVRTGDILLFNSKSNGILSKFDFLIKFFTKSNYNHIAIHE